jgi:hypothetical protein
MSRSWLAAPLVILSLASPAIAADPPAPGAAAAPPPASGQPASPAKTDGAAVAQTLFDEGIELMKQGKLTEACAKLEASNKAAWAPGTTINLADCYEQSGRLASAWAKFLESEPHFRNRTPPDPRADIAKQRAEALFPKLSRLTIEVPADSKIAGLTITRDGDPVDEAQWGTGVPVDPGTRVVEASAPGKKPWKWEAAVGAGGATVSVKIPPLEAAPVTAPPATQDTGMPLQRKIAIGVGAAGVVGLAVGGIFGGLTLGKVGDADKTCTPSAGGTFVCDAPGAALRDEAAGLATISTAGLIAGGVLAAGGVVLWLTAPGPGPAPAPAKDTTGQAPARRPTAARPALWVAPTFGSTTGFSAGARF